MEDWMLFLGLVATKSDKASFKPVSSVTETSQKIEISLILRMECYLLKLLGNARVPQESLVHYFVFNIYKLHCGSVTCGIS